MGYKILFSDLDGTFLRHDMTASPSDWDTVHQMAEEGIPFVPCTGRVYSEIPEELREDPAIRYYISANGAVTYDKVTDTRTVCGLDNRLLHQVIDTAEAYGALYFVRHGGRTHADANRQADEEYTSRGVREYDRVFLQERAVRVADFAAFTRDLEDTEMVIVFLPNVEATAACKAALEARGEIHAANSYGTLLEVFHAKAGKGNALLKLAETLGIARGETIAVGDTGNDISSITAAGLGLAVGNATDPLKAAADAVIVPNDASPITYIYETYFKGDSHAEV